MIGSVFYLSENYNITKCLRFGRKNRTLRVYFFARNLAWADRDPFTALAFGTEPNPIKRQKKFIVFSVP